MTRRISNELKKECRRFFPGRTREGAHPSGGTQVLTQRRIVGQAKERRTEAGQIAGRHQQALAFMLSQVRQIAGPPANDRQAKRHRLAVHRAVRLLQARQHEDVGRLIQCGHPFERDWPVNHHPPSEVRLSEARTQASTIPRVRPLVAGQMQRAGVGGEAGNGIEQTVHAFALDPVRDAQERCPPPLAKIARRWANAGSNIAAGRHHPQPCWRHTVRTEVIRQRLTGNHQASGVMIGKPVQPRLDGGAKRAMIDAARWLMEHPDERHGRRPQQKPRSEECSGDAIQHEDIRPERAAPSEHGRCV
ncbi:MAG TPA: hypothetical protein VFE12_18020 [Acetobacteraceae bacterium]|nr:hypothetical protein [Acetobacteraceae bacterium]